MSSPRATGIVTFSILLETGGPRPTSVVSAGRAARLIEIFARHRVPATWAVGQPWNCSLADKLLTGQVDHELALLGDPSWSGRAHGRSRAAMELSRRLGQAREAGMAIASAVLPSVGDAGLHAACEVLAAEQVRAVWSPSSTSGSSATRPVPLCDGLWHTPSTAEIAPQRGWLAAAKQRGQWRRTIQNACDVGGVSHLWLNAATLEEPAGFASIETAVRAAASARAKRGLQLVSLAQTVEILDAAPRATRSHSILRAA